MGTGILGQRTAFQRAALERDYSDLDESHRRWIKPITNESPSNIRILGPACMGFEFALEPKFKDAQRTDCAF